MFTHTGCLKLLKHIVSFDLFINLGTLCITIYRENVNQNFLILATPKKKNLVIRKIGSRDFQINVFIGKKEKQQTRFGDFFFVLLLLNLTRSSG